MITRAELVKHLCSRRLWVIFFMGLSSGLPLLLVGSTLSWRLATLDVDKTTIGFFTLVTLPYALKFLWAPLFDRFRFRHVLLALGHRRLWIIILQLFLMIALVFLGSVSPVTHPHELVFFALLVSFFSASQDIVVDAYRIEILPVEEQALGASATQLGYRFGLLLSGAGALFLSDMLSWQGVYSVMAACVAIGLIATLLAPEPAHKLAQGHQKSLSVLREPFRDFSAKPFWLLLLLFIVLYKLADAVAGVMANPFYYDIGFTASDVALVSKFYGLGATLLGIFLGGILCVRFGLYRGLLVCGVLQIVSNFFFAWQAYVGAELAWLYVTITAENLSGGMGSSAFVAFLSSLCNRQWAATQYALLTSFMAFGRTFLSSFSGWFADHLTWQTFFVLSGLVGIPALILLYGLRAYFSNWLRSA